jgi:hypothetical protein
MTQQTNQAEHPTNGGRRTSMTGTMGSTVQRAVLAALLLALTLLMPHTSSSREARSASWSQ